MKQWLHDSISPMVFPAPNCPSNWYRRLESRSELSTIVTCANETIPIVYFQVNKRTSATSTTSTTTSTTSSSQTNGGYYTILYSHGNAEDLSLIFEFLYEMAQVTNCNVLSYDYVGYSFSKKHKQEHDQTSSEDGCYRSIDAVWKYATETLLIPANRIILFGRSIGSGPTIDLASRSCPTKSTPTTSTTSTSSTSSSSSPSSFSFQASPLDVAGVVLQSPLASGSMVLFGASSTFIPWTLSSLDLFRNYTKIGTITSPVAILHGTVDEVVPCNNGRKLYTLTKNPFQPPLWVEGKGHNDIPIQTVFQYIQQFIDSLSSSSSSSSSSRH